MQLSPDTNQWLGGIYLAVLAGIYLWHIGEWWKTRQMVCLIVWAGFHLSAVSNLFVCIVECVSVYALCVNHFKSVWFNFLFFAFSICFWLLLCVICATCA